MKTRVHLLVICLLTILFSTGCGTLQYEALPSQSQSIDNPEFARIYVIAPRATGGSFNKQQIYDNERSVGRFRNYSSPATGSYICWEREPGKVTISSSYGGEWSKGRTPVILYVKKGSVYYLVYYVQGMDVITEQQGKELLKRCVPPEMGTRD